MMARDGYGYGSAKLSELLAGLATVTKRNDREVSGLSLHSQQVNEGELFIAVRGENCDGRDYVLDAEANGAVAIAREKFGYDKDESAVAIPSFEIAGLKKNIGVIADRFYGAPSSKLRVIGITGTNGKTTCAYLLAQALQQLGTPAALLGTLGVGFVDDIKAGELTTADAVTMHRNLAELLAAGADAVCMEVSSHGLAQSRVGGVEFEVALLTNLSRDHLDYHRDMNAYRRAKRKLFRVDGLQHAVVNLDDAFGRQLAAEHSAQHCIGYGGDEDLTANDLQCDGDGIVFATAYKKQNAVIRSPLIGALNVSNLLAVIGVLVACGYELNRIASVLPKCYAPPGRMQRFGDGPTVVVDYAHTPDALQHALTSLADLGRGKLIVVFGCGGERDVGKRPQMGAIAARFADRIIITDDNPRDENQHEITEQIRAGAIKTAGKTAAGKCEVIHDRRHAIGTAIATADADDIILIAGKGHETTQAIGGRIVAMNDGEMVVAALSEIAQAKDNKYDAQVDDIKYAQTHDIKHDAKSLSEVHP